MRTWPWMGLDAACRLSSSCMSSGRPAVQCSAVTLAAFTPDTYCSPASVVECGTPSPAAPLPLRAESRRLALRRCEAREWKVREA
jgi:hypothetical protein